VGGEIVHGDGEYSRRVAAGKFGKEEESSFSEEKEAKRLLSSRSSRLGARCLRKSGAGVKVFLLLFLQKKAILIL
jgi:hypothetical protein